MHFVSFINIYPFYITLKKCNAIKIIFFYRKGVRKEKELSPSPGPIYDIGDPDVIKPKSPAFTIRQKWKDIETGWDAGPASYTPLFPPPCPCKTPTRGASLGIRYNDFTGIFRTGCDSSRYEPLD